jgi:UDP-glucose 4-epimerase
MNWLITGGCGFIGRNLINQLKAEKLHKIRVIDNMSAGSREDLAQVCQFEEVSADAIQEECPYPSNAQVTLIAADILDEKLAGLVCQGIDTIVHLAANTGVAPSVEDPRVDCMSNVIGTFNYLEACRKRGVKKFVFASSGAPIGVCIPPIHEELSPHPVSPYGASKLCGEAYCSAYYRTFGVETVALRFGNVYGPFSDHKSSVVAKFIKNAIHSDPLVIYGDGHQTRDFIYIDDLIRAILSAVRTPDIGGEVFQIASSRETTVVELIEKLLPILADCHIKNVSIQNGAPRIGDVLRNFSDTTKALQRLQWKAEVDLSAGLKRTVSWFLDNKYNKNPS